MQTHLTVTITGKIKEVNLRSDQHSRPYSVYLTPGSDLAQISQYQLRFRKKHARHLGLGLEEGTIISATGTFELRQLPNGKTKFILVVDTLTVLHRLDCCPF